MTGRFGLEIRAMTPADTQGVAQLMAAAGRTVDPRALGERLEAVRRERGAVLIALDWGPPSGLIVLHWYQTLTQAKASAQVSMLLVGPDARRRGLGRLLLKAGAQTARAAGCGVMHLCAALDQPELQAFCRATGFTEAGPGFSRPLRKTP